MGYSRKLGQTNRWLDGPLLPLLIQMVSALKAGGYDSHDYPSQAVNRVGLTRARTAQGCQFAVLSVFFTPKPPSELEPRRMAEDSGCKLLILKEYIRTFDLVARNMRGPRVDTDRSLHVTFLGAEMSSMILKLLHPLVAIALVGSVSLSHGAVITFDTVVSGATSFAYDGDGDSIADVLFSTTDSSGFNTVGPGTNMSYIQEPGIEGTTLLSPDLKVNFFNGAIGTLGFGFAMSTGVGGPPVSMTFSVFDLLDNLLGSVIVDADFTDPPGASTLSSFPEALVSIGFGGVASYATFDFNSTLASRYIIDNFSGSFGSTERVPEPATLALVGIALAGLAGSRRRSK